MSIDGHRTKWRRKIAENYNRLSTAHERSDRQTTDGRTDDDSEGERSSSSSSVVIYTQRQKTTVTIVAGVSTKQIRLQLPAESFDCDVGPTDIFWQTVPESWSGSSERTIAKPCACGNARTGVVV